MDNIIMYNFNANIHKEEPIILGIETSCDETAAAIVKGRKILSDEIASSADLQALYGGENGYPQAVLVAKNELIESYSAWTKDFVEKVETAAAWLQEADGATIVSTVSAHVEDVGTQTSLKAPLLSTAVVNRCRIRFTYASADKTEVYEFLNAMLAVNSNAAAIPSESFYWNYTQ